jgi:hypothetical protein
MIYSLLWSLGYHLRRCSFCNRKRVFKRGNPARPHPDDMTREELQERFDRKIAESLGKVHQASETSGGNMTSKPSAGSSESEAKTAGSSVAVAEAVEETDESECCPKCASPLYRRSRRRWYERLVKRPKMARCLRCNHRFPFPG